MVSKKLSGSQCTLGGLTIEDKQLIANMQGEIEEIKSELEFIETAQKDEYLMINLVINVERYLGSRGPWYLNLENDVGDSSFDYDDEETKEWKDCPKVDDYEIGYFGKDNAPGTYNFILDRLKWAQKKFLNDLKEAEENLKSLENSRW